MDFLEIIDEKWNRAEDDFIAYSDNNLNNCKQLLDYIQALKNIQSMYRIEPSVADSNHTDLVNIKDAINNGVKNVNGVVNSGVSTITSSLNTISNKLDNLNTISNKLDNLNSKSQLIIDELHTTNDYLRDANEYLKTIASK